MKITSQIFLLLFYLSLSNSLFSQTGINTKSPLGVLHIDPNRDTKGIVSSPSNDEDDIIIDFLGNVGIGTTNPQNKLHIKTTGTNTNPIPGFCLQDGNEGDGKFLTIDKDSGLATWKTLVEQKAIYFDKPTECPDLPLISSPNFYKTNATITLPKGRWVVMVAMFMNVYDSTDPFGSFWLNTTFADPNTIINNGQPLNAVISPDVEGSNLISMSGMMGYDTTGVLVGSMIINNKEELQTYYYMAGGITVNSTATEAYLFRFGGYWSEDTIVAFRIPSDI